MSAKHSLFCWLVMMLPFARGLPFRAIHHTNEAGSISQSIRSTWQNPTDTLTILFIIGGDVVAQALAQLAGPTTRLIPVAFSFGWVAYSFAALANVFGNGRLMPDPDYDAKVINVKSRIQRDNQSWVLGRLLRDLERPLPGDIALSVSIYEFVPSRKRGPWNLAWASWDWCYISGVLVILLQLGVAAIPCGLYDDWGVLAVTAGGILVCILTGLLPQWPLEKYPGRKDARKVIALTRGNGSRHVIIFINPGIGIDLEDLAAAQPPTLRFGVRKRGHIIFGLPANLRVTQVACVAFACLWITLLITVEALDTHPWYLLLVGGIGMLQNVTVAGAKRTPVAHGFDVELVENITGRKVMRALMDTELVYPGTGEALVEEFFPAALKPEETTWWKTPASRTAVEDREAEQRLNKAASRKEVRDAREKHNIILSKQLQPVGRS